MKYFLLLINEHRVQICYRAYSKPILTYICIILELYFDAKHLERGLNRGVKCLVIFFKKSVLFS